MTVHRTLFTRRLITLALLSPLVVAQAAISPATPTPATAQPSAAQQAWKLKGQGLMSPAMPAAPTPASTQPQTSSPQPVKPQLLTIQMQSNLPALVAGQKTTLPYRETLVISPERAAAVQAAGKLTPDTLGLFDTFLKKANTPARDARFEQQPDGSWAVVQRNALSLDAESARAALTKALLSGDKTLVLSPKVGAAPKRTLDFFAAKGITSFLSAGQTSYAGSSQARMTNIHAGAKFFKDRLFEGKEFSFNKFIGDITEEAGYVPGLVISGERTASGIGGGICQVSTTVFRTLYGAGLKILERRNHSYRVYYYAPQGLDATIYQPSQDLRFANDAGPLWFQADWDDKTASLVVQVFGKPRDFEVHIQEPKVLKTTPAPADKFITDKTLKAGEKKQVDWAAEGAVIEVERQFVRGGKVFKKDTLHSEYKPWPNIFLVGK